MKKVIYMTVAFMLCVATLFASNQQTTPNNTKAHAATEHYTCPMHKDVVGKKTDKCPKCEMSLVKKAGSNCDCSLCKDAVCKKCPKCSKSASNSNAKCICTTCKDMTKTECSKCSKCCGHKK